MKSGFTEFQQQRMLERMFGNVAYSEPTVIYIGVSTTVLNADGTGSTEPTDPSYARVAIDNNISNWEDLISGAGRQNAIPVEWAEATTNWGTVTYVAGYDTISGGNMLWFSELTIPKPVGINDVLRIKAGEAQIRIQITT